MIDETELAEGEVEKSLPDREVGLIQAKGDGNMAVDVDELDGDGARGGWLSGVSEGVGVGGGA